MILVAVLPVEALFVAVAVVSDWPARIVAVAVCVGVGVPLVRRALRIELVVDEREIRVRNFWRERTIPWEELVAITCASMRFGFFAYPAVAFEVRGSSWRFPAQATSGLGRKANVPLVAALAEHAAVHGVEFRLEAEDLVG